MSTTLSACRWNWCTSTFSDHASLRVHVETEHIATAEPVKRKDITLLQRTEDGTSLQESLFSKWTSDTDSQPQALPAMRHVERVERAVMTDPVSLPAVTTTITSLPVSSKTMPLLRSNGSTPRASPKPSVDDKRLPFKFSEMRGTPSPTPSSLPPSPGTGLFVNGMKHNTVVPTTPRRSPHVISRTPGMTGNLGSKLTPIPQLRGPMISVFAENPTTGAGRTNADDSNVINGNPDPLPSQWQPQSQLPLQDSFESGSVPVSTINPTQLHLPIPRSPSMEQRVRSGASSDTTPSKLFNSSAAGSSRSNNTPKPSSSTPHPPSPSTLDISNVTSTDISSSEPRASPLRTSPSLFPQSATSSILFSQSQNQSVSGSQLSEGYASGVPFESGFGYGYGDEYVNSQPLQTQAPFRQDFDSSQSQSQS